jgi:hypothetical protein
VNQSASTAILSGVVGGEEVGEALVEGAVDLEDARLRRLVPDDLHTASVLRVCPAMDVAGLLQPVEHPGRGSGGEAGLHPAGA